MTDTLELLETRIASLEALVGASEKINNTKVTSL